MATEKDQRLRAALGEILSWYQSDEELDRPLEDILGDIASDMPGDRQASLWVSRCHLPLLSQLELAEGWLGQPSDEFDAAELRRIMQTTREHVRDTRRALLSSLLPVLDAMGHPGNEAMSEDDWEAIFQPQKNHLVEPAPFTDQLYQPFGEELAFIQNLAKTSPNRIWSVVESDGQQSIVFGMAVVNLIGYIVTSVPWNGSATAAPCVDLEDLTDHSEEE